MITPRVLAILAMLGATLSDRLHAAGDRDRGSETTEKVMWIALLVVLVLAVYGIFQSKIIAKITSINL